MCWKECLFRMFAMSSLVSLCFLSAAQAGSPAPYVDIVGGVYGPTASGGAWDAIEDLYDQYHWVHEEDFSANTDFIGPLLRAKAGVILFQGLDLSLSVGYTWADAEVEKTGAEARYDYGDPYWDEHTAFTYDDKWELDIVPVSVSLGWSFVQWSVVRPYIAVGADAYFWGFDGSFEGDYHGQGYQHASFSEDGVNVGGHANLGAEFGHPRWWFSVVAEAGYTYVPATLGGDAEEFLGEDDFDLSGWSLLLGARMRKPTEQPTAPPATAPPAPGGSPVRL